MKCKKIQEKEKINLQLKNKKKQKLREKGITLIALVVTIIILLILSGVTLNMALSGDGLLAKARKAATDYNQKAIEEKLQLMYAEKIMENNNSNSNVKADLTSVLEEMTGGEITEKDIEEFNKLLEPYNEEVKGITSVDELAKIGQDEEHPIDGVYVQLSDIDEITAPIGSEEKPFKGVYNGNGKSIKKLEITAESENVGIFAINEGTIRNIKIDDCSINSDFSCVGGIVGTNSGIIDGCTILKGEINTEKNIEDTSENGRAVGGICGLLKNGGIIQNCENYANILSTKTHIGGISGWIIGGKIISCINRGNMTGFSYVGGITGNVSGSSSFGNSLISKCENYGRVEKKDDVSVGEWMEVCYGGISGGTGDGFRIEYCINNGNVITSGDVAGGIIGDSYVGIVVESENNATITGNNKIGGIVGLIYNGGVVNHCKNSGEVVGTADFGKIFGKNLNKNADNVIDCEKNN